MTLTKTLAAAAIACAMSSPLATAWDASVTFYTDSNFRGSSYKVNFSGDNTYTCYTFSCFNNVASSAHWEGIPKSNAIGGPIHIAFYTDDMCRGVGKRWKSTDIHPINFQLDGINDQISSFKVTEIQSGYTSHHETLTCSKSIMGESGLLTDGTEVTATETTVQKANATASPVVN